MEAAGGGGAVEAWLFWKEVQAMSWWHSIELTKEQLEGIETTYFSVIDREDEYGVAGGAHWELLMVLDQCGIHTNSTAEAKRIALDLFSQR